MTQILIAPHFAKFPQSGRAMIKTSFSDYLLGKNIFPIMPVCSLKKDLYSNFLKLAESFLQNSDGIILQGGENLKLTSRPNLNENVSPRYGFEMALVEVAIREKKPILGICRGLQLLNIFFGGNVCDVSVLSSFSHDKESSYALKIVDKMDLDYSHGLQIQKDSLLTAKISETSIKVNSAHRQAILELGQDLVVEALSPDKIIEAIRHKDLPIYAVQWHPEHNFEDKINLAVFEIWEYFLNLSLKN